MKKIYVFAAVCIFSLTAAAAEKILTVLFPAREAILSAQVEGVLRHFNFAVGDMFPAGATLAELKPEQFLLESQRAKSKAFCASCASISAVRSFSREVKPPVYSLRVLVKMS